MVKNVWVQPQTVVQQFVANEYVASSCGNGYTVYKFDCNAHGWWGAGGFVWQEDNGKPGLQDNLFGDHDKWRGAYRQCHEMHTVTVPTGTNVKNVFHDGYLVTADIPPVKNVVIWDGEDGNNTHCCVGMSIDQIETVKS